MSLDIFVQNMPAQAMSLDDVPDDYEPGVLGTRSELISQIHSVAPHAEFSDLGWGTIEHPDYSIDVNLGDDELVTGFTLQARGEPSAATMVGKILVGLGRRGVDTSTGEFFDLLRAAESLRAVGGSDDQWANKALKAPRAYDAPRFGEGVDSVQEDLEVGAMMREIQAQPSGYKRNTPASMLYALLIILVTAVYAKAPERPELAVIAFFFGVLVVGILKRLKRP